MEMCYSGALVMPSNYAVMDDDEMMYLEGGTWTAKQLEKNILGLIAAGFIGYVGNALINFVKANKGLSFGLLVAKGCATMYKFVMALPLGWKVALGGTVAATFYALGVWDLF